MNIFMVTVSDEKEGYVKIKRNDLMETMQLMYENGFEDGKQFAVKHNEIEPGKIHFIGEGES